MQEERELDPTAAIQALLRWYSVVRLGDVCENQRSANGAGNTAALLTTTAAGGGAHMADSNPIAQRFWAKVRKTDTCWLWTASTRDKGYGAFSYRVDGKQIQDRAHRYSWVLRHGAIPDGLWVLHRCDVPACVNPAHLFLGTSDDNISDMIKKGRHVKGGTHAGVNAKYVKGTAHPNARLTPDDVRAIREQRAAGASFGVLAKSWGLSIGYVFRLVNRKVWRDVE